MQHRHHPARRFADGHQPVEKGKRCRLRSSSLVLSRPRVRSEMDKTRGIGRPKAERKRRRERGRTEGWSQGEQGGANEWASGLTAAECTAGAHPLARIEPSTKPREPGTICTAFAGLNPCARVERDKGERIYARVRKGEEASTAMNQAPLHDCPSRFWYHSGPSSPATGTRDPTGHHVCGIAANSSTVDLAAKEKIDFPFGGALSPAIAL